MRSGRRRPGDLLEQVADLAPCPPGHGTSWRLAQRGSGPRPRPPAGRRRGLANRVFACGRSRRRPRACRACTSRRRRQSAWPARNGVSHPARRVRRPRAGRYQKCGSGARSSTATRSSASSRSASAASNAATPPPAMTTLVFVTSCSTKRLGRRSGAWEQPPLCSIPVCSKRARRPRLERSQTHGRPPSGPTLMPAAVIC